METKLRWLGSLNWIVDNSKSDSNEFKQQNPSDSKSDVQIVLWLQIQSIFDLFSIKTVWIWPNFLLKDLKRQLKLNERLKKSNLIKKVDIFWLFDHFRSFLISSKKFWSFRYNLDIFLSILSQLSKSSFKFGSKSQLKFDLITI